ncbi:MAG TPA: thioredoxin, partial [Burkholderiaceae bacterium]|nr:thioredoxin [Burkholderiaceae bacterium]
WGGFGREPKFPNPTALEFFAVLSRGPADDRLATDAGHALRLTLDKMYEGGIYDHLRGGFARYSTDTQWLVPHFEKMLYDNAMLLPLYAEAAAAWPEAEHLGRVVHETVAYLGADMRHDSGTFFAATDADSEGVEGKYFVWTPEQLAAVLDPEKARLVARCYDVRPGGNWQDPHGHGPQGASILHVIDRPQDEAEGRLLAAARAELLAARRTRVPPGTDDKVLTAWNGLAITGLAEAGRLLGEPRYVAAAQRTADFLLHALRGPDGALLRTYKEGSAKLPATLDDHAFVAEGLFHLASASGDLTYLTAAIALTDEALTRFYDAEKGLFFLGPAETGGVTLVTRPVSLFDSAIPSGLSVTCMNLLRLAALADDERRARYQQIAESTLLRHTEQASRNPAGMANLIAALDLWQHGLTVTVLVDGDEASAAAATVLHRASLARYGPDHFVLRCRPGQPVPPPFDALLAGKAAVQGRPTAYVCRGPRCTAPITDPSELAERLGRPEPL